MMTVYMGTIIGILRYASSFHGLRPSCCQRISGQLCCELLLVLTSGKTPSFFSSIKTSLILIVERDQSLKTSLSPGFAWKDNQFSLTTVSHNSWNNIAFDPSFMDIGKTLIFEVQIAGEGSEL